MATIYSLICWGGSAGKSVTVSNTTDLVTLTNHGLRDATGVAFTSGTLPTVTGTALALNTTYYAKSISSSTFELYYDSALTSKIDFTSTGSSLIMKSAYYLGLSDKSRWTYSGTEYIYDGLVAWNSGRSTASSLDEEVCEIGMAWHDAITSGTGLSVTVPAAKVVITTLVNGVRSEGFHNGILKAGYCAWRTASTGSAATLALPLRGDADGFTLINTNSGYQPAGLSLGVLGVARNIAALGAGSSTSSYGIISSTCSQTINCIAMGWSMGLRTTYQQAGILIANCIAAKNNIGIGSAGTTSTYGYYYNNISIGNTTDWATGVSGFTAASNNFGGSSSSPWYTGTNPTYTIATTDFANWGGSTWAETDDLSPVAVTSPQVDRAIAFFGISSADFADSDAPSYPGSSYNTAVSAGLFVTGLSYTIASVGTTDFTLIGASANTVGVTFKATGVGSGTGTATLNAQHDVGAYEFDLGYGAWPATATISLTDIVSGSRVLITKSSDGSVLYNDVPGTSLSHSTSHIGGFNVVIRKASATPFYREFQASGTTVANQTTTIKCLQKLDE